MMDYSKPAVPVLKQNTSVNVEFGLEIIQITNFDEREQHITMKTWLRKRWRNELLTWRPEEWGGVTELHFDQSYLWVPDILLYNNAEAEFSMEGNYQNPISLTYDGNCTWLNPITFRVLCEVDISYFPFDKQHCYLKFGSWSSHSGIIDMSVHNKPVLTDQFKNSTEWTVYDTNVTRNLVRYKCCVEEYTDVTYHISLLRKPKYYVFNVIIPCVVLVAIILVGFYLPVESGERISLVMTILLAVVLFLQLVNDALPKNSESLPVLSVFYLAIMIESTFSLLMTCVTISIYYNGESKSINHVPKWVQTFFMEHFAKWYGVDQGTTYYEMRKRNELLDNKSTECAGEVPLVSMIVQNQKNEEQNKEGSGGFFKSLLPESVLKKSASQTAMFSTPDSTYPHHKEIIQALHEIHAETRAMSMIIKENEDHEFKQDQWKYLAQLVDRFFFMVFLFAVTLTSVCILVPAFFQYH